MKTFCNVEREKMIYDVIVIGAGPSGMTAALYASRANLRVALIEQGVPGGQMNNTSDIENYPGFSHISGADLAMNMFEPLESFGVEYLYGLVSSVEEQDDLKVVYTDEEVYKTKTVIIATGAKHKHLNVKGEEEYNSHGVSYCAVCDGAFFKDDEVLVVGGGDSAVEEAIYLTQFAKKVTIVHRRCELRAQQLIQERAFKNNKIDFLWNTVVESINGNGNSVTDVEVSNVITGKKSNLKTNGVFIYVGLNPVSDYVRKLGITDENGWVITDDKMNTSISGIFAIGDVRQKELRQITTAVGDGAIAGIEAYNYISSTTDKLE